MNALELKKDLIILQGHVKIKRKLFWSQRYGILYQHFLTF